ncbi:hypothetical protein DM02DRAFT_615617 [Periconia macrospinosa]|uniref:Uncharacterized protein n=1 Tax=Periconia macrospinosa TaxID=97972 RepID=A0A2V1DKN9_9PLEO|nr:hypothetical protein DM02DRAFT_615617 [Periconia macrospinosa]
MPSSRLLNGQWQCDEGSKVRKSQGQAMGMQMEYEGAPVFFLSLSIFHCVMVIAVDICAMEIVPVAVSLLDPTMPQIVPTG